MKRDSDCWMPSLCCGFYLIHFLGEVHVEIGEVILCSHVISTALADEDLKNLPRNVVGERTLGQSFLCEVRSAVNGAVLQGLLNRVLNLLGEK